MRGLEIAGSTSGSRAARFTPAHGRKVSSTRLPQKTGNKTKASQSWMWEEARASCPAPLATMARFPSIPPQLCQELAGPLVTRVPPSQHKRTQTLQPVLPLPRPIPVPAHPRTLLLCPEPSAPMVFGTIATLAINRCCSTSFPGCSKNNFSRRCLPPQTPFYQ